MSSENRATTFLNVDIDLEALSGLGELLHACSETIIVLHASEAFASFELVKLHSSLEEAVGDAVALVHALPPQARALWDACESRVLNIGIQGGTLPEATPFALTNGVARALAEVGFGIVLTIYAVS